MTEWQLRVVAEKQDLDARAGRLGDFIDSTGFEALPVAEQGRLRSQYDVMRVYGWILGERVVNFV